MNTPLLTGKVAVVTGAAGGLGSAICRALAAQGATVALGYHRSQDAAASLASELPGSGHFAVHLPVTDPAALNEAAGLIAARSGRVDILVNCAGTTQFVPHDDLDGLTDSLIDDILATNVRGPFAAIRAFRPWLAAHRDGLVVNISSIAARTAMGSNVMYCASKAALDNLTASLARALGPHIRVLSVSPGLIDTEFVRSLDSRWRDEQAAATVLGRLATPDEVAEAVIAAATLLRFTTGVALPVDGGRPLR
ncbi:SDR family oxidoreductase [Paraburkholderia sp. 1N]|uniref:SDR family oxidoreductase n=1 Tax=Paraburkholderia solitsugae TaxID=2675748 RepID=A0ABX2C251_9BURK|nr:SDR family oxidoreductase [Paraburkholderia solitsugae]NPT46601.1 SDR family oxidoreductase [Paraburkholderia solitsugae]